MKKALPFFTYVFIVIVGGALLSYPAYLLAQEIPALQHYQFGRVSNRAFMIIAILAIIPYLKKLKGLSFKSAGMTWDKKIWLSHFTKGYLYGLITMLIMGLVLSFTDVRPFRENIEVGVLVKALFSGFLTGFVVSLIEEPLFRGFLYNSMTKTYSKVATILILSVIFGCVHFFKSKSEFSPRKDEQRIHSEIISLEGANDIKLKIDGQEKIFHLLYTAAKNDIETTQKQLNEIIEKHGKKVNIIIREDKSEPNKISGLLFFPRGGDSLNQIAIETKVLRYDAHWYSGFVHITKAFYMWESPKIIGAILTLFAVSVFLHLVVIKNGNLIAAIGIHTGWVNSIKIIKKFSKNYPDNSDNAHWLVSNYDKVTGYAAFAWIMVLMLIYLAINKKKIFGEKECSES